MMWTRRTMRPVWSTVEILREESFPGELPVYDMSSSTSLVKSQTHETLQAVALLNAVLDIVIIRHFVLV